MAAITSAQSGNWNNTATWVGGVIPVSGDTVIIANAHTVTVPSGYTAVCGKSPEDDVSTPSLQCNGANGTGVLVVNGTFRFRGSVRQGPTTWTVNAGGRLEFDNSQTTTKPLYTWGIGRGTGQLAAILRLIGEAGNRATITNAAGSDRCGGFWAASNYSVRGNDYMSTYDGCGNIIADYTDVIEVGPTNSWWWFGRFVSAGLSQFIFRNSKILRCSRPEFNGWIDPASVFHLYKTSILEPVAADSLLVNDNRDVTTGYRLIDECIIEGKSKLLYVKNGFTVRNTAVKGAQPLSPGGLTSMPLVLEDSLIYNDDTTLGYDSYLPKRVERVISLRANANGDDDHLRGNGATAEGFTIDGLIAEYAGTGDHGEVTVLNTLAPGVTGPVPATFRNVIVVPNAGDKPSGAITALVVGAQNFLIDIKNCTFPGTSNDSGAAPIFYTEMATAAQPATVTHLANNIIYSPVAASGLLQGGTSVGLNNTPDGFFVNVDYNCHYNAAADIYVSPDSKFVTTPGANDLNVDPQFKDWGRDFLGWAQTIDPTITTWDEAWAEIRKKNDDFGYDARWDWRAAYTWIREGYTPTNTALLSGYDGGYIGAVQPDNTAQLPADMAVGNNSSNNTYSSSGFLLGMRYDLISPMIQPYMSPIQTVLS